MKAIFKVLLIVLPVLLLTQCNWFGKGEHDPNESVDFTDSAFLYALIEEGVDTNGDSLISYAEVEARISLNLPLKVYNRISDLTGIKAFVNLESLSVQGNSLTSINLSKNTALTDLACSSNQLTNLDVSNNTELTKLFCGRAFTSLDLSNNPNLIELTILPGQLTSLDLSNNTVLTRLRCSDNKLANLDLSNNTALTSLSCSDNQLVNLNLSNNTSLTHLDCSNNQLTSLDVSNNTALKRIRLRDNPNLLEVCVWIMPFPPEGVNVDLGERSNITFTTECGK